MFKMKKILSMLIELGYTVLGSDDVQAVLARSEGGTLNPPGLVVLKSPHRPYTLIQACYAITSKDSLEIPVIIESFGLNYQMIDGNCFVSYRLFNEGYDATYLQHVLNNLGACVMAIIEKERKGNLE